MASPASEGPAPWAQLTDLLDALAAFNVRVGGGWGIDVLAGRVTRQHHDVDLFLPTRHIGPAVERLVARGWARVDGESPCRVVLELPGGSRADLNGLVYGADGHAVQASGDGDVEVWGSWAWTETEVAGRRVVCLTAEAQRLKHRGYPQRAADASDLAAIAHIDEPRRFDPSVRLAEPADERLLEGIETTSDLLLEPLGLWPLPAMSLEASAAERARTLVTLVAGRPAVGFCRIERVDENAHVGEIAVLPELGRMGIGSALMDAACAWARDHGYRALTLTTFVDPPFNAPWYERLGFEVLSPPYEPELARVVELEADLAELGPRVVMTRRLHRAHDAPGSDH